MSSDGSSSSSSTMQQMSRLVNSFYNRPESLAFREPVDPVAMNIPDYLQIIKSPMDLGTVKANLESGRYLTAEDVAKDVRLIWSNCILYNQPDSEFGQLAANLAKKFDERYVKIAEKDKKKAPATLPDPVDARAPSLEEKVAFTYQLYRTTKRDVGEVMEQVDARCPQALKAQTDDEIELNVDMLDPTTFRVVERLVHQALHVSSPTPSGTGKIKATSGGSSKKRKGSVGEVRPKKQRM